MEESLSHGAYRCMAKQYAVFFLVLYTFLMGFVFLSYLYTLDISGSNKAPADDVIILHKSSVVKYKDSSFDEGKLLVKISFHQPGKPAAVLEHYKSMRTGETLKKRCKKCALVSSSGQMLGSKLGKEIDSMPCVIRMNASPTEGYEEDVGARTTVRVVCYMTSEPLVADSEKLLIQERNKSLEKVLLFGLNTPNHKWALNKIESLLVQYPETQFYSLDEVGEMESDLIFEKETGKPKYNTNTWLSTGWFTMLAALDMCEELHVYGMVHENYCDENPDSTVKYHYFQTWDVPTECGYYNSHENTVYVGGHRFITEKAIFARWARMFNIHFHNPGWKPSELKNKESLDTPFVIRQEVPKTVFMSVLESVLRWSVGNFL
ncbi:alpha-N-acetylgalactosaminide alpha-2,6-sialyltransferase 3-like isoform X2 [Apostichopus japonicus]|uniref:alpha-N-acetylgalactosaminide alpha-2,6-sialyltransferase 3-like isoform X2 n=1 Tax=Stichopus japonicus TaxID=307972 RepID=UPI003AB179C9